MRGLEIIPQQCLLWYNNGSGICRHAQYQSGTVQRCNSGRCCCRRRGIFAIQPRQTYGFWPGRLFQHFQLYSSLPFYSFRAFFQDSHFLLSVQSIIFIVNFSFPTGAASTGAAAETTEVLRFCSRMSIIISNSAAEAYCKTTLPPPCLLGDILIRRPRFLFKSFSISTISSSLAFWVL